MKQRFSIGEVSDLCHMPIKTLRYYDEINLLVPEYRNEENKYRYYSKEQLTTVYIIKSLKLQGFSLKMIKEIISSDDLKELKIKMLNKCKEISEEINDLQNKLRNCNFLIDRINLGLSIKNKMSDKNYSTSSIEIEDIPAGKIFFTRKIMKGYSSLDVSLDRWTEIYEQCNKYNIPTDKNITITFYENMLEQFLGKDCDVEFGILVDKEDKNLLQVSKFTREFGNYKAATKYHIGKYSEIVKTYISMYRSINDSGYEVAGPVSEEYIISPLDIDDENEQITKIIIPIKKL